MHLLCWLLAYYILRSSFSLATKLRCLFIFFCFVYFYFLSQHAEWQHTKCLDY